jgi:hypothetical protein
VGDIKPAYKRHLIDFFFSSVTEAPEPVLRKASDRGECWKYFSSTSCISYLLELSENEETRSICMCPVSRKSNESIYSALQFAKHFK